jgi:hypothetical protein
MLAFHALVGPFKAVGSIFGIGQLGPSENIDAGCACSSGPIQSLRNGLGRQTLGPFVSVDIDFP